MNTPNLHTDPDHRYHLPSDVRAALENESDEERARLAEVWALTGAYLSHEPDEAVFRALGAEIWHTLEATLRQEAPAQTPKPTLRLVKAPLRLVRPQTLRWGAMAACIILLVAVGLVFSDRSIRVEAPYGAQITHTLPDGSTVTLNSGTLISYAASFSEDARQVELERGEAFFDVTHHTHSFSVETFNSAVTVLGTSFNVRAWPSDFNPATEVTVASGTVRFAGHRHPGQGMVLTAGEAARLARQDNAPLALDNAHTENALAWRTGSFKFSKHSLRTVVDELERRFDVRITVSPESLLDETVGILIENPLGAEEIIRDICELDRCQYRTVPGGYEITPAVAE